MAAITGRSVAAAAASKRGGVDAPAALRPHTTLAALQLRPSGSREATEAAAVLLSPSVRHRPVAAAAAAPNPSVAIPLGPSASAPHLASSLRLTTRRGKSMLLKPSASTVVLPALSAAANDAARLPLSSPRLPLPPPPRNTPKTLAPFGAASDDAAGSDAPEDSLEGVEVQTDRCGGGTAAGGDSKGAVASPMMQALRRLGSVSDSLRRYSRQSDRSSRLSGGGSRQSSSSSLVGSERQSSSAEWHDVGAAAPDATRRAAPLASEAGSGGASPFRGLRGLLKKRRSREAAWLNGGPASANSSARSAGALVARGRVASFRELTKWSSSMSSRARDGPTKDRSGPKDREGCVHSSTSQQTLKSSSQRSRC